jgi:pyruvate/2-oxoglutarate dehydrogenase complex dihydrolipoamide acyltransferase (E2) component
MAHIAAMPKQGLQMTEGTIIEWYAKEGDTVKAGRPLFNMETDKLAIDIDSEFDGVLLKILEKEGSVVPITKPVAIIGMPGEDIPALNEDAGQPNEVKKSADKERIFISPRARKKASELNVDYMTIKGTGPDGIIIERDITENMPPIGKNEDAGHRIDSDGIPAAYQQINPDADGIMRFLGRLEQAGSHMETGDLVTKIIYAAYEKCPEIAAAAGVSGFRASGGNNAEIYMEPLEQGDVAVLSFGKISDMHAISLSVTYDKRYISGKIAGEFLSVLKQLMEDPYLAFI